MGRNTTTPLPQSLDRFSIGEIQDLSGVAEFYDAGTSKWLRSAVLTSASNLSTTTKTNLAAAGTSAEPTVVVQSALSFSYNGNGGYATYPIQRISASSISVVPSSYQNTTAVGVGVMTSAGLQFLSTGQTSIRTSSPSVGTNGVVASNNTTIFSYTFTSATALAVSSTTNGTTWTAQTVSGLPTFAITSTTIPHASQNSAGYTAALTNGWRRNRNTANDQYAVFWCGARFVLIGHDATNYVISLSTDGFTFGGDNTTTVIGATAQAKAGNIQFYRNGNNCYLNIGTAYRYSTDGGVTWADSTFAGAPDPTNYVMQYNQSDPSKLVIMASSSTTTAYYTSNSGQTWSTSRTLPFGTISSGFYYKGTTLVLSTGTANQYRVSTDDGVTWTTPIFPVGVLSNQIRFFADANRFYAGVRNQPQILTSSDAVTWTIVTLPQNFNIASSDTGLGMGIVSFDSNTVALIGYNDASGYNQCLLTNNGGVTWTGGAYSSSTSSAFHVGNAFVTPDAGGVSFLWSESSLNSAVSTNVLKPDLANGGALYKTGTNAITPVRTGSFSYVRVG